MRRRGLQAVAFCAALSCNAPAHAQSSNLLERQANQIKTATIEQPEFGFRAGSIVGAPIPFSNATFGSGLILGGAYLYNTSEGAKPSMFGIAALKSDNGTEAYGGIINYASPENRWLLDLTVVNAELFYDLFLLSKPVPARQTGQFVKASLAYGPTRDFSYGVTMRYIDSDVGLNTADIPSLPSPFGDNFNFKIGAVGLTAEWDNRDNSLYPTQGQNFTAEAFYAQSIGSARYSYGKFWANLTAYRPLGRNGVMVGRLAGCAASTGAPFFDLCAIGGSDGFRGFPTTQFLDERSASIQFEYRHTFTKRLGGVAFVGAGTVAGQFPNSASTAQKHAGGLGLRYRLSKKFPVDFAIDGSRNSFNENQIYVYVGQRF